MAIIERPSFAPDITPAKEQEFIRTGVILVLAHQGRFGEVSICTTIHRANSDPLKRIREGDLGLPSETLEKADLADDPEDEHEDPVNALKRCLREEVGIEDILDKRFGIGASAKSRESIFHLFNLTSGQNGDSSNALGHVVALWTRNPLGILNNFERAKKMGITDDREISGIDFMPLQTFTNPNPTVSFRTAPHAPTVVSQVLRAGLLR